MYEEFFGHFGLQRNPFHVSPDPKRFYSTVAHDEALLQLVFGIESRKGLLVLTGEPGTGKTTILQYLLEWLGQYKYSTAYVFHPLLPSMDLLQLILSDFGISCNSRSKSDLVLALQEWLVRRHAVGDRPVIIVDEAQVLRSRSLDELNVLLDMQEQGTHLVQVVLAGQPELEEKLHERKLAQLRQRIAGHCKLRPLTLRETSGYIASRLQGVETATRAGSGDSPTFSSEIVAEIYRYSKGIPRVVNLVCEHALLAAYADRRDAISSSDVLRVAQQFELGAKGGNAEPYYGDTFCRLIPFPKLGAPETNAAKPENTVEATETLALESVFVTEEQTVAFAAEPITAEGPRAGAVVPQASVPETIPSIPGVPPVVRAGIALLVYCRGVARSFAGDCLGFAAPCVVWLRSPLRTPGSQNGLRELARTLYNWLRLPMSSSHIPGQARRLPSTAHKHS
jgi:general secretion pathway protein A